MGAVVAVTDVAASGGATRRHHSGVLRGRAHRQYWETSRDDAPERFEMGGKSFGGWSDGGAERQLPSPQGTNDRRRCQSVGGSSSVLETEGSGLRSRSLESASAGKACPRACRGGRFSCVVACGQSNRTSNPGGTTSASGKGQVLPGTARSGL